MIDSLVKLGGKRVVVTGASGFIGSALVDALVKNFCKVIRVSRMDLAPLDNVKTIKTDVRDAGAWSEIVAQADIIYNLAANTSVYEAALNPAASLNSTLLPITHLIKAAQQLACKPRVVFASTATVYGLTLKLPVAEKVKPEPVTVYDLHKLFAEQQLALAAEQGLFHSVSLRLANVYGPSSGVSSADDRGILTKVTAMALQGKDLMVYGDGNYLRDYVYITDVVNAFLIAGISPVAHGQSFNVGSGLGTTVKQMFSLIAAQAEELTGQPVRVQCVVWPNAAASIEFRQFTADIDKYTMATGWKPQVDIKDGISLLLYELAHRIK